MDSNFWYIFNLITVWHLCVGSTPTTSDKAEDLSQSDPGCWKGM